MNKKIVASVVVIGIVIIGGVYALSQKRQASDVNQPLYSEGQEVRTFEESTDAESKPEEKKLIERSADNVFSLNEGEAYRDSSAGLTVRLLSVTENEARIRVTTNDDGAPASQEAVISTDKTTAFFRFSPMGYSVQLVALNGSSATFSLGLQP